ncbi:MAG: DUF5686 and carboxypeptidase regulatory-like domain-containing protein [Bacteroidota bacterium]
MIRKFLPSFLLLITALSSFAQTWTGKVVDKKGAALPFINVYFEGTSIGTTTNNSGEFSLNQPSPEKKFLMFQFVGFEKKRIDLSTQQNDKPMRIVMTEQIMEFGAVTVAAYKKDPAYYVIKQAQKKRKYYLNQVDSYSCKIYMKGTTSFVQKPDKLPGIFKLAAGADAEKELDSLKLGLIALSESFANVHYSKKDGYKEEMLASKVSGSSQSFSWNRATDVLVNFYEDKIRMDVLNERGFISPIAPEALLFYDYKLLGTFKEDGQTINQIQVMPKRKADPVFTGTIYITEDLWNIHSMDLRVTKDAQIEWVDSINIHQSFTKIEKDIYMPLSLQMTYHFGLFGFRADYNAIGNISEYEIGKVYMKNFFKNEVFVVQDTANKQDSTYWNQVRPVILSNEETGNYAEGDSIKAIRNSKAYLDSIDKASNKFRVFDLVTSGYSYINRYDSITYRMNSLFSALTYSSIDGVGLDLRPSRRRQTPKGFINDEIGVRYGFSSNRPGIKYTHSQLFNQKNYFRHYIEGGYYTNQINEKEPIDPLLNGLYTLIDGKNYAQFYQKSYLKTGISGEVTNGLVLQGDVEYSYRQNLTNAEKYNFNERRLLNVRNLDAGPTVSYGPFDTWDVGSAYKFHIGADIRIKQKYATYPNRKVNYDSKYPKLKLDYQFGIVPSSNPVTANKWNRVEAEIFDYQSLGMIGAGEYSLKAGAFLGEKPKNFVDYFHFLGNQTAVLNERRNSFQNLPYYDYSTNGKYVEAHYQHHFYGFLLNKIPLIRKLKWKEVAGVNFLYTEDHKDYTEVYAGIDNIFRFFKIQFVSYYQNGQPLKPALRIGLRIN